MPHFIEFEVGDWHRMDDIGRVRLTVDDEVSVLRVYDRGGFVQIEAREYDTKAAAQAALKRLLRRLEGTKEEAAAG